MTALALSVEHEALVAEYARELELAGTKVDHPWAWGGRAFCARFGDGEGWLALDVGEQLALNVKIRRFVTWLIATRRLRPSAAYLLGRRVHLADIVARHHPDFFARFRASAAGIGFGPAAIDRQWRALVHVCALEGVAPDGLTHAGLDRARAELDRARAASGAPGRGRDLRSGLFGLEATLFHAGMCDELPRRQTPDRASEREAQWVALRTRAPRLVETLERYLGQVGLVVRPGTQRRHEAVLREFARVTCERDLDVRDAADIGRRHVEAYRLWLAERPTRRGPRLHRHTIRERLGVVRAFFERIIEWGWEDAPARVPLFSGDLPIADETLPRFLDDAAAARLLAAARADPDPFVRLCVEFLARTGLRRGEFLGLTVDAVVRIGSAYWLHVPLGKLHTDRYIPLHPQLKDMLDEWLAHRPSGLRSDLLFIERGRPIPADRVERAVAKAAAAAGIGHVVPHQLRHTLATQAINRGMSLEAIAALLGHRSMSMTLVYARIADRTVADEYFAVSERVEALYTRPRELPAEVEGSEMARLRHEMDRRLLGNGYCARPVALDCQYETICESCTCFVTTPDFRPTLERQREDALAKGQLGRQRVFDGLLARLDEEAS